MSENLRRLGGACTPMGIAANVQSLANGDTVALDISGFTYEPDQARALVLYFTQADDTTPVNFSVSGNPPSTTLSPGSPPVSSIKVDVQPDEVGRTYNTVWATYADTYSGPIHVWLTASDGYPNDFSAIYVVIAVSARIEGLFVPFDGACTPMGITVATDYSTVASLSDTVKAAIGILILWQVYDKDKQIRLTTQRRASGTPNTFENYALTKLYPSTDTMDLKANATSAGVHYVKHNLHHTKSRFSFGEITAELDSGYDWQFIVNADGYSVSSVFSA